MERRVLLWTDSILSSSANLLRVLSVDFRRLASMERPVRFMEDVRSSTLVGPLYSEPPDSVLRSSFFSRPDPCRNLQEASDIPVSRTAAHEFSV